MTAVDTFQRHLMSRSQILERGLSWMECVARWSCGFETYVFTHSAPCNYKGSRRDPICRWEPDQGKGIGTTMVQSDKRNMDTALKIAETNAALR